jgi:hypothetical protein
MDNGNCYDSEGIIFREPNGVCYTSIDSRVPVVFPYTPKSKYVDVQFDCGGTIKDSKGNEYARGIPWMKTTQEDYFECKYYDFTFRLEIMPTDCADRFCLNVYLDDYFVTEFYENVLKAVEDDAIELVDKIRSKGDNNGNK